MANYSFRVAWFDCDPAQIVFYPRFLSYMNEAAHQFFEDRGFPLSILKSERGVVGIPMVSVKTDFRSPMTVGDRGEIETQVMAIGRSSLTFSHRILKSDGQLVAEATEVRVYATAGEGGVGVAAVGVHEDVRAALLAPA